MKCTGYYAPYLRNKNRFPPFRSAVHEDGRLPADLDRFPGPGQSEAGHPGLRAAGAVRHRPLRRAQASSRKGRDQRPIEELLGELAAGDRLVVSELSRLGRSLGQVIQLVDELVKR